MLIQVNATFDKFMWFAPTGREQTPAEKLAREIKKAEAQGLNSGGGVWSVYDLNNKLGLLYTGGTGDEDPFAAYGGVFIAANLGLFCAGESRGTAGSYLYLLFECGQDVVECPTCNLPCIAYEAEIGLRGHSAQIVQDFEWRLFSDCCHTEIRRNTSLEV